MAFVPSIPLASTRSRASLTPLQRPSPSPQARKPYLSRSSAPPRMLVVEANSPADMDKILTGADDALVVVDFSTTWCGPCKMIAPIFEEMSEKHKDVVFVKVMGDIDEGSGELMKREGIRAVPAFHFWKNQKRLKDITGAKSEEIEKTVVELKGPSPATDPAVR